MVPQLEFECQSDNDFLFNVAAAAAANAADADVIFDIMQPQSTG